MGDGFVWVRTDECEDIAGSIRHYLRCVRDFGIDDQAWKWAALALHSAIQGGCVCHLTSSAPPLGAVTKQNAEEWLGYFEASRSDLNVRPPATRLMSLPALLKAVRKPSSAGDRSVNSDIPITDAELAWLCRFHDEIRNQLTHFEPRGWSIEISGIPDLAKLVARLLNQILDVGWAFRHQDVGWQAAFRRDLKQM